MGLYPHGDGEAAAKCFPACRSCDYCESAAAMLFCRVDSAFFCIACDSKVHNANTTKHERVWMCEVCEQAPALVSCKADSAVLCSDCDRDIHSANPLSRRHERTPVVPFYENAESAVLIHGDFLTNSDSWITPTKLPAEGPDIKSIELLFSDSDHFLDFEISQQVSSHLLNDCVVPVQTTTKQPPESNLTQNYSSQNRLEIDFTKSSYNNSYTTPSLSLSHSVSSSTMDMGVVPDGSDISYPLNSVSGNQGYPLMGVDRKARVLRYREKRKNRRFQKTIRYASRKAYAETRPRIKGRFAKRTEAEPDGDAVFMSGSCEYVF